MKYCINCGTQLDDDAKFCNSCGNATEPTATKPTEQPVVEPAAAPASAPVAQPAEKKGGKGKLLNMRAKTAQFEKKHSLIVNLLVLCCSFVILMVALFAPIKVSAYIRVSDGPTMYTTTDGKSVDYEYIEIDQTMFDMIGAVFYAIPGSSAEKINIEAWHELDAAYSEYRLWNSVHPGASADEQNKVYAEIYGEHLSNINYFGYLLANNRALNEITSDKSSDSLGASTSYGDEDETVSGAGMEAYIGELYTVVVSLVLGVVITILAIIMAIMSLINLIKAIVGLCKKTNIAKFDKYMLRMLKLSGASLVLMWVSPMLATGGGMFAISMFVAITMLVLSVLRSLFVRGENWLGVIKRGVTAFLCMLAFYLLCANIFVYNVNNTYLSVKPGYAFYNMLQFANFSSNKLVIATNIVGFVMFLLTAGFIMSWAEKSFGRNLRNVVNGKDSKPAPGTMIATAVLLLVGLVYGLCSNIIINVISENAAGENTVKWMMSGHVWASLVLMIAAIVLHYAFKPENICKGKNMIVLPALDAEPVPAAATADGATVAAPAEAVNSDTVSETTTAAEEPVTEAPVAEEATESVVEEPAPEQAPEQTDNGAQAD